MQTKNFPRQKGHSESNSFTRLQKKNKSWCSAIRDVSNSNYTTTIDIFLHLCNSQQRKMDTQQRNKDEKKIGYHESPNEKQKEQKKLKEATCTVCIHVCVKMNIPICNSAISSCRRIQSHKS